eukprot:6337397-Pyramimonas_sp.AAC.1
MGTFKLKGITEPVPLAEVSLPGLHKRWQMPKAHKWEPEKGSEENLHAGATNRSMNPNYLNSNRASSVTLQHHNNLFSESQLRNVSYQQFSKSAKERVVAKEYVAKE